MATRQIIGIKAEIISEDKGVPAHFHVISSLNMDFANQLTYVTVSSYYSKKIARCR